MVKSSHKNNILVVAGLVFCCISDGYIFGQMSGMINALAAPDSPIPVTQDDISWIASTINITCICGFVLVGILSKAIGRRFSTTILGIPVILCWIALYFAQDKFIFLLTRVIVGVSYGGIFFQTILNCGEYLPPSTRHFACNIIITLGNLSGVMLGHILSLLMDWRNVALLGLIPSGLACLLPLFWIESPSWLASKGKFDNCEKAFRKLRQDNEDNKQELRHLIEYEKKNQSDYVARHSFLYVTEPRFSDIKKVIFACKELYFWKITLTLFVVNIYRATAGRILLNTLAITMLQEITGRTNVLLFTLLVDGFGIIGAAVSFYLIKKLKMRKLLFTSGVISNTLLVVFSASLYFVPNETWYPWIKVVFLALYYIVVSAGPYPVLDVFIGEVHPLEIKEFSSFISGSLAGGLHFLLVQLAASMFATMGYSGTFLFNAFMVSLCLVYLSIYMPETKGRTLQEIEMFFKTGTFNGRALDNDECTNVVLVERKS